MMHEKSCMRNLAWEILHDKSCMRKILTLKSQISFLQKGQERETDGEHLHAPKDKKERLMESIYTLHVDSGHSWLEVPMDELFALGIAQDISSYSRMSLYGHDVYLNEEGVLVFWQARNAKNKLCPRVIRRFTEGWSFVRCETHYTPDLLGDATIG